MKRLLPLFLIFTLTACSTGGNEFQPNEQSFISGNGIVTIIEKDDREISPPITGPLLGGGNYAQEQGRVQLMNVWASWCSPCRAEAPALQDLSVAHPDVQFVGVLTRDNLVAAQAFVDRFGLTYPTITDDALLADFTGQLSVNAIPTTLLIDKAGKVAARISGEITYSTLNELLTDLVNE
ncbi:MAG: TlpA family protein disulfide reductase [Actinomycetota bacterium]